VAGGIKVCIPTAVNASEPGVKDFRMAKKNKIPATIGHRALEMTMRDVLDHMLEISLESGFSPLDGGFEIIEIAPEQPSDTLAGTAESADKNDTAVVEFPALRAVG
jgi:hypothetical protein